MTRSASFLAAAILAVASPAFAAEVGQQSLRAPSPDATPNATVVQGCNTPILKYGNGPLLQNVKIFDVFYNTGNPFKDMLTGFYTTITQSAHFDWLIEYNAGSYKIGRGSFAGLYEDTKSATTKATLSDSAVQTYLSGLIDGSKVTAPDANTLYMIYFPSVVTITSGGGSSCVQFCAYHSSYTHNSKKVRYAVMPDVTAGACANGCGPNSGFQNVTDVSSHEMIEAVTDPDGGSGWYDTVDNNCGEIGDICATNAGETAVVSGYTVQKEWSNKNNDCIATDPNVVINDFTMAASSTTLNVPAGGMATTTITLTKTAGMAENVPLSITNPVTTLPGTFAPASITSAGGTSTLTITASPTATVGTKAKLTVKATGGSAAPTVDINVTVVDAPDMAMPSGGGSGGTGGGGSGGTGGGGSGGVDGTGTGGNGNNLHGDSGCSVGGADIAGSWAFGALVLLALALRRRHA